MRGKNIVLNDKNNEHSIHNMFRESLELLVHKYFPMINKTLMRLVASPL